MHNHSSPSQILPSLAQSHLGKEPRAQFEDTRDSGNTYSDRRTKISAETSIKMSPSTLSSLPQELLSCIASYMPRQRDVSSFGRVNRYLYTQLSQYLYKLDAKSDLPRALVWGCIHGQMTTAELALGAGSDVDTIYGDFIEIPDPNSASGKFLLNQETTPLLGAAAGGHLHIVKRLFDEGANGEWMDEQCLTALHLAAQFGREDVVDCLVKRFPELVYVESDGRLAADFAGRHEGTLRMILEAMDPRMCTQGLETAAIHGHDDVFFWLLDREAHVYLERWKSDEVWLLGKVCSGGTTQGHIKIASALIDMGLHVDCKDDRGYSKTPLYAVCALNNPNAVDMAGMLLEKGAEIRFPWNRDILEASCRNGNIDLIEVLLYWRRLSKPADDDDDDDDELKHLNYAALESGHMDCFDFVYQKFPPNKRDTGKLSCLLLSSACDSGNLSLVRRVLELGVETEGWRAFNARSPLNSAWEEGNIELLKLLLEEGVDKERTKYHPDEILVDGPWPDIDDEHQLAGFQLLVDHGADPLVRRAETALHRACKAGATSCVKLLVDKYGADVNEANGLGNTPLLFAIDGGKVEIVDFLLSKGAETRSEMFPELAIALAKHIKSDQLRDDMMEYLIGKGAAIWSEDSVQITRNASQSKDVSLWMLISSYHGHSRYSFRDDPFRQAGRLTGSTNLTQILLNHGANDFDAALCAACKINHFSVVKLLLENGANPNSDQFERTPLGEAAAARSPALVKLLLSYGADPNLQDTHGHAPIHRVVRPGHESSRTGGGCATMKALLDAGASVYKAIGPPNHRFGRPRPSAVLSPTEVALTFILQVARCNHAQTLAVILDNTDVQEVLGREHWVNALHSAAQHGCSNTLKLLVDRGLVDIEDRGFNDLTVQETARSDWQSFINVDLIQYLINRKQDAAHNVGAPQQRSNI